MESTWDVTWLKSFLSWRFILRGYVWKQVQGTIVIPKLGRVPIYIELKDEPIRISSQAEGSLILLHSTIYGKEILQYRVYLPEGPIPEPEYDLFLSCLLHRLVELNPEICTIGSHNIVFQKMEWGQGPQEAPRMAPLATIPHLVEDEEDSDYVEEVEDISTSSSDDS